MSESFYKKLMFILKSLLNLYKDLAVTEQELRLYGKLTLRQNIRRFSAEFCPLRVNLK